MTTDFPLVISCDGFTSDVHIIVPGWGIPLSPCCSCQGEEGKRKEGGGGLELGGAVCLGGGSLFPWFPRVTSPMGGILWGQQCLQNIWIVARLSGSWYFWTETAEEIFSAHCSAIETISVSGCGPLHKQKQTFSPFSLNLSNKNTTNFIWYQKKCIYSFLSLLFSKRSTCYCVKPTKLPVN